MEEKAVEKKGKGLSGNFLKWIAIITMLIDHATVCFLEEGYMLANNITLDEEVGFTAENMVPMILDLLLRCVGRVAFFIFCFLIVEGFLHTRNVWKYSLRLVIFALISEIPYNLMLKHSVFALSSQNVYWTLSLGLLALILIRKFEKNAWICFGITAALSVAAWLLHVDYSFTGVLLIVCLYEFREKKWAQFFFSAGVMCIASFTEICGLWAFLLFRKYNGTRGGKKRDENAAGVKLFLQKYAFYLVYPVHLFVFWLIRRFVMGIF